jgi:hypothetical protein
MVTFARGLLSAELVRWTYGLLAMSIAARGVVTAQVSGQDLPQPYNSLVQYGLPGLFVVLFLTGQLVSKRELARESARADRAEARAVALTEKIMGETIPLLTQVQGTMGPAVERLAAVVPAVARLATDVDRVSERLDQLEHGRRGG